MALQDTDLLLVQRGTQSYKLTGANAKSFLGGDLQAVTDRGNTTTNDIISGGTPNTGAQGATINPAGFVAATADSSGGKVFVGRATGSTTETSEIFADGSATFAGDVDVSSKTLSEPGVNIRDFGTVQIRNDGAADALQVYNGGNSQSDQVAIIGNDGSAQFAGKVTVNNLDIDALTTLP